MVVCISVAVDRYLVSFDMTDRCCFWKTVLCWFGLLAHMLSTLSTEWEFLRLRFLSGDAS